MQENALFLKGRNNKIFARLLSGLERASAALACGPSATRVVDAWLTVVVVGGGPTGVELCAELADFGKSDIEGSRSRSRGPVRIVLAKETMPAGLGPLRPAAGGFGENTPGDARRGGGEGGAVTGVTADAVTYQPSLPRSATAEEKSAAAAEKLRPKKLGHWSGRRASAPGPSSSSPSSWGRARTRAGLRSTTAYKSSAPTAYSPSAIVPCRARRARRGPGRGAARKRTSVGPSRDRSDKPFEYKHAGKLMLPRLRQRDCRSAPTPGVGDRSTPRQARKSWEKVERANTGAPAFTLWQGIAFLLASPSVAAEASSRNWFAPRSRAT